MLEQNYLCVAYRIYIVLVFNTQIQNILISCINYYLCTIVPTIHEL